MTEIELILEQARLFVIQHAPAEVLKEAVPFAIVCLVVGVGLSVLGAKLSRFGLTSAFAVLGGYAGAYVGREAGYPTPLCGLAGVLMAGVIGYQTFRLWVGFATAIVFALVALGLFSYQRVLPHVAQFESASGPASLSAADAPPKESSFVLPSPQTQQAYRERSPKAWAEELWAYVTQKDAHLERNGKALGLAALVTGLFLGVMAVRWALVLSTSLVGTALVTTAMATILTQYVPQSYQALQHHPASVGMGVGGFFVGSLILQTMLTRSAPASDTKSRPKSKA